jgi:hypothetical protein
MYKDVQMKVAFHKERIMKEFIKKGIYPQDTLIANRLNDIDSFLALTNHKKIHPNDKIDVSALNNDLKNIWKDLEFLYNLLYEFTAKEFISLKAFIDTHMDELEDVSLKYKLKAEQEASSTSLGKTVFFKHSGFDVYTENNVNIVDLGTIEVNKGSRIACLANVNNIEADKIIFGLKDSQGEMLYVSPYNYSHDSIVIPGNLNTSSYTTTINKDQIISGPIEMNLDNNVPSINNRYIILGGKDKVLIRSLDDETKRYVKERPTRLNTIQFDSKSYISFYVVGGSQITFRFNKKPISTNFELGDYKVSNLKHIHHFFIECDEGFMFDFEVDKGEVYALKENGVIDKDKLYFARDIEVRNFYVEEYKVGDKEKYYAFLKIFNDDEDPAEIESVIIKELLEIGGHIE